MFPSDYNDDEIAQYIRQSSISRGIDPNIALKVWESEGKSAKDKWQSDVVKNGKREPSYGPYQLYMGGGLGNEMQKKTGLDPSDPNNWRQGVDFALDNAKTSGWGPWYGAKRVGITGMQGIGGNPAAAPQQKSPARQRFDQIMTQRQQQVTPQRSMFDRIAQTFNPISSAVAAEGPTAQIQKAIDPTGTMLPKPMSFEAPLQEGDVRGDHRAQPDTFPRRPSLADLQTKQGVDVPKSTPVVPHSTDPGMAAGFAINDAGFNAEAPAPSDEQPMDIRPPERAAPEEKPGFFDRMRSAGMGPALVRMGAGLAAGSSKGWGAGIGLGLSGAQDALDQQRRFGILEREAGMENLDARTAYPILREHFQKQGDPDADKKALLVATTNPKAAAKVMGISGMDDENFSVAPEYFTTPEGKLVIGKHGDRGTQTFVDVQGNELKGDQLNGLKRESAIRPIDSLTETVLVDRSGAVLARFPKNNQEAARDKGLGDEQAKALAGLPSVRSNAQKIKDMISGVVNDPELSKFTGMQGYLPTWSPGAKAFESKLAQLDKKSFMMAFESLKGAGAITEQEGAAATKAMARLADLSISDPGYVEALKDFANEVDRLVQVAELKATGQWQGNTRMDSAYPNQQQSAPSGGGSRYIDHGNGVREIVQ
jgi:hypothetical protein